MLEKELNIYNSIKDKLLAENTQGGFVVIKEDKVLGVWVNRTDALKEGIKEFGNTSFLVKDINENVTHAINFSRNLKFINALPNTQK